MRSNAICFCSSLPCTNLFCSLSISCSTFLSRSISTCDCVMHSRTILSKLELSSMTYDDD